MTRLPKARIAAIVAIAATAFAAQGQNTGRAVPPPDHEFEFARLAYPDGGYSFRGRGAWTTDYPEAEFFFHKGVSRLTRVEMGEQSRMYEHGVIVELDDDSIFEYPWLYAVEVGEWRLNDFEAQRLREYLLRGGFLMVDDFHGTREWLYFLDSMQRVFPDRPILDIEDSNEVLHVVYEVDERIQIPGIVAIMANRTYEDDGYEPIWRGIYDDDGRLMVIINHNMDLGDAWEHADDISYPQEMTTLALHFAVNYVIYAMTH